MKGICFLAVRTQGKRLPGSADEGKVSPGVRSSVRGSEGDRGDWTSVTYWNST